MMEYAREEDPAIVKEMRGCCGKENCWKKLESEGREGGGEEQGEREDGGRNSRGGEAGGHYGEEGEGGRKRAGKSAGQKQRRRWRGGRVSNRDKKNEQKVHMHPCKLRENRTSGKHNKGRTSQENDLDT